MTIRIDELTALKTDADTKAEALAKVHPEALAKYRAALTRLTEMRPPAKGAGEEVKAFEDSKAKLRQETEAEYLAVVGPTRRAERLWNEAALAVAPERWRSAVDGIGNMALRIQVACVLWWDYFGDRPIESPWPHLDEYRAAWTVDQDADPEDVRSCLKEIGFPERIVRNRCKAEAHA